METQELWRIIITVQGGSELDECDRLYDGNGYGTCFPDCKGEAVIDYLKQWDDLSQNDDDFETEEPKWVNNGTDEVFRDGEYILRYNATIGGVYMLYRHATEQEKSFYFSNKNQ